MCLEWIGCTGSLVVSIIDIQSKGVPISARAEICVFF